jgi:hypothetical protein
MYGQQHGVIKPEHLTNEVGPLCLSALPACLAYVA